jgi:hypothetical protein
MQVALSQVLEVSAHFLQSLEFAMAAAAAAVAMGMVHLEDASTALVEKAVEEPVRVQ